MRNDINERKEEIINWIKEKRSKAFICRELKCKQCTLNGRLKEWGIVYNGNLSWAKGLKSLKRKTALEYLKTKYPRSHFIKIKLIEDGIKEHKCERCGNSEWLDKPVPLELHHIDGDHYNNTLENFELLCPNCHALEPNNAGAARKNKYYCKKCSKDITKNSKSGLCKSCSRKASTHLRKVKNRPSREILLEGVKTLGYSATGRKYGVSDNAIRKWLK